MRIIALLNPKGGSGKTTAAVALADALATHHGRTVLVDLDPNANATASLGIDEHAIDRHVGDLLTLPNTTSRETGECLWPVRRNLAVLPATYALARTEIAGSTIALAPDRDLRLARVLRNLRPGHDMAVVDTGPALSLLAFNAVRAADTVLVPADCASHACTASVQRSLAALRAIAERTGAGAVVRVLPTRAGGGRIATDNLGALEERWSDSLVRAEEGCLTLPEEPAFAEAAMLGRLPSEHAPASRGVAAVVRVAASLAAEIDRTCAHRIEQKPGGCAPVSFSRSRVGGIGEYAFEGSDDRPAAHGAVGLEAKPGALACGGGNGGDDARAATSGGWAGGCAPVSSRAAELAARTRAIAGRIERADARRLADPTLARAIREAERAGPLMRRA